MTLSAVTLAVRERTAADLAAFTLAGAPYIMWRTADFVASRLWWRRHDAAEATETFLDIADTYVDIAAVGRSDGATVLIVFSRAAGGAPTLYATVANVATGATVVPAFAIAAGTKPALAAMPGDGSRLAVVYRDGQTGAVHLRESYDSGLTWSTAKPVLNNKVNATVDLSLVTFDGTHLSIGQVGSPGRLISEDGSVDRSRPVSAVVVAGTNRVAVMESTVRTGQVADNLRGRAALDGAGNVITTSRTRMGADDTVGSLAVYDTVYDTPALVGSAILAAGAAPGGEIVRAPLVPPGAGVVIATVAGSEALLDLTVFDGHALYAAHASAALTGRAGWVNLTSLVSGEFNLGEGTTRVGAIAAAAAAAGGFDLLAVGYSGGGAEWLRLGAWETPPSGVPLIHVHRMPAKVNSLALQLTGATAGSIFVGMTDRVNVYAFDGLGLPIRLLRTHVLLTGGEVMHLLALDSGNVVAALGIAGVAVFGPGGETLGVGQPSSMPAMPWKPATAYSQGALVRPQDRHPYAPQRRYFICTRAGTSGIAEPAWGPTGTVNDPNGAGAGWQEVGSVMPNITSVAVEQDAGRIYAAGVLGGASGTAGRIYNFDAGGLVSAPPRCAPVQYNVVEGSTRTAVHTLILSCGTAGAAIYYTTDGSPPGSNATLYDPLNRPRYELSGRYHVRAIALAPNLRPSVRTEVHWTVDLPDLAPVRIGPDPGAYFERTLNVFMVHDDPFVTIRYTTDGSDPTPASPVYAGPFAINVTTTVKARAYRYGWDDTPIKVNDYAITWRLIPDDSLAVSHFLVMAGAILDHAGITWNQVGTVPKVAAAPIFGKAAEAVGPTATADYYELAGSPTGTDVFDTLFTGDFIATLIFRGGANTNHIFGNWAGGTGGLMFSLVASAPAGLRVYNINGAHLDLAAPSIIDGGLHVVTLARKGNVYYAKIDSRAVQTATITWPPAAPNATTRIGRSNYTGEAFSGLIYEGRFVARTIASEADLDALHAAIIS